MEQPFNSTAIPLEAKAHGLDEDGTVFVRNQFSVSAALAFNAYAVENDDGDMEVDSENVPPLMFLESVVCGWNIKSGVELPYSADSVGDLPTSVFQAIMEEVPNLPLAQVSGGPESSSTNLSGMGDPARLPA